MGSRRTNTTTIDGVQAKAATARRAGWEAWAPGLDPAEVRRAIVAAGGVHLEDGERSAYGAMMPATWWANWSRGWDDAAAGRPRDLVGPAT